MLETVNTGHFQYGPFCPITVPTVSIFREICLCGCMGGCVLEYVRIKPTPSLNSYWERGKYCLKKIDSNFNSIFIITTLLPRRRRALLAV